MKMTVGALNVYLEDLENNINNLTKLQSATAWDEKDRLDDIAGVNVPFNSLCSLVIKQLTDFQMLIKNSRDITEVTIGG